MGRLRFLRKGFFALFLVLCVLLALTLVAIQIEQHLFRRRAEKLLSEVQAIELRKTTWQETQTKFQEWGAKREIDGPCNEHKCALRITLNDFVTGILLSRNIFVRLDDYFRWRLKRPAAFRPFESALFASTRPYATVGGRPAIFLIYIGMRDGVVWSKGISLWVLTYARNGPWTSLVGGPAEYTLMAEARSVPRFDFIGNRSPEQQLAFHPDYKIGHPGGCTGCIMGWVKFTPYAAPDDVHRLMRFDLSCLTRWHPCLDQHDIMPDAWTQYLAERERMNATSGPNSCPPPAVEIVGRDSAHIALAEIIEYRDEVDSQGYHKDTARVRVLERLKGLPDWKIGEVRDVAISLGTSKPNLKIQSGVRLILFAGFGPIRDMLIDPGFNCPVMAADETNLALIRQGISQDYSATDEPQ